MYRRAIAFAALLAIAALPVRAHLAHAGPRETCVVGAPTATAALDNAGVLAQGFDLGPDFHPAVRPFYNFAVVRVYLYNTSSVPFAYSPADFTLEEPTHRVRYTFDSADDTDIRYTQLVAGTIPPGGIAAGDVAYKVYADYDIQASFILHWSHTTIPVPFDCV